MSAKAKWLGIECPLCGGRVGEPCVNMGRITLQPRSRPHKERIAKAQRIPAPGGTTEG